MAELQTTSPAQPVQTGTGRSDTPAIWRPFENLRREVDRLFEDFDGGFWRMPTGSLFEGTSLRKRGAGAPAADVVERDKDYQVTVELPGLEQKDLELKVSNDFLTIKGEKREEKKETKKGYYLSERSYGAFQRSFTLPTGVDADRIEADFKNGVLTVTLPKKPEAIQAERKIDVKAS
ncbi:MAG: Hsp20/alpha crystallin family protein [Rhodospirillales bacterium]|nr:Hsp20/alpha crystallin family protein [Rhodospirillales bacterium]